MLRMLVFGFNWLYGFGLLFYIHPHENKQNPANIKKSLRFCMWTIRGTSYTYWIETNSSHATQLQITAKHCWFPARQILPRKKHIKTEKSQQRSKIILRIFTLQEIVQNNVHPHCSSSSSPDNEGRALWNVNSFPASVQIILGKTIF